MPAADALAIDEGPGAAIEVAQDEGITLGKDLTMNARYMRVEEMAAGGTATAQKQRFAAYFEHAPFIGPGEHHKLCRHGDLLIASAPARRHVFFAYSMVPARSRLCFFRATPAAV